jgi:hypothetical protein
MKQRLAPEVPSDVPSSVSPPVMRVLDLDLDFFVSPTPKGLDTDPAKRLDGSRYSIWTPQEVTHFLEQRLGLSTAARVPGRVATTHDMAFDTWKTGLASGQLTAPFEVIHVDNHADLGVGDAGWHYLTTELLHQDSLMWATPRSGAITEGNYLAFAVAAGWVRSIIYVAPPCRFREDGEYLGEDRMQCYFLDNTPSSGELTLPVYERGASAMPGMRPLRRLPTISFKTQNANDVRIEEPFDFAFVAQSPRYTPVEADELLPIIQRYLKL